MRNETLRSLLVARTLFERAGPLTVPDDPYPASAGLVLLQDAVELVLYACALEMSLDRKKTLDDVPFATLIDMIAASKQKVYRSGMLKAMNRERVNIKHYGQLAEPATVRNYLAVSAETTDRLLRDVIGKSLVELQLSDLLRDCDAKSFCQDAAKGIEEKKYWDALVAVRKAIFCEIEEDYYIEEWSDYDPGTGHALAMLGKKGHKAPWYTRNQKWISEHVQDPFDYLQLDHDALRLDLIEWGAGTQDYWNLSRMTPMVVRTTGSKAWLVKTELEHAIGARNEESARYCLDRAVSLIGRKQAHSDSARYIEVDSGHKFLVRMKRPAKLFRKASTASNAEAELSAERILEARAIVPGFASGERFVRIANVDVEAGEYLFGYVLVSDCEVASKPEA
jgi:hypothetical protein